MFDTLLIANRGEIACRIIRSAKKLGIKTIAVYSAVEQNALHVELADISVPLGGIEARDNYLNISKLIEAARSAGAEAIHPGYGFLSENAEFAEACDIAGIVFVGPSPSAMRAMGSKSAAKIVMEQSGVPLLPGYHGEKQDIDTLQAAADDCGYPLMLKASAGGGGKGMRIVNTIDEFAPALEAVKREAEGAFGDDTVLLERYLIDPRHIEIQVFGDNHGNFVHLFERDCSIQRRHQKVLEEAPAPGLSHEQREKMGEAAIAAARAINYSGAGTIEFIVDREQQFYFMEMNTRLQVEHPVTEMITGVDLVEWQLRVASGETLPVEQNELSHTGHSIEVRLYAEDADRDFLPSTGTLDLLTFPREHNNLRIDTGVTTGNEITVHYDPMIAKIISYGSDRNSAIRTLLNALENVKIAGVATNTAFLSRVLGSSHFKAARLSTSFLQLANGEINPLQDRELLESQAATIASLSLAIGNGEQPGSQSAWQTDGWRLNAPRSVVLTLRSESSGEIFSFSNLITAADDGDSVEVNCNGLSLLFGAVAHLDGQVHAQVEGQSVDAVVFGAGVQYVVRRLGIDYRFKLCEEADLNTSGKNTDSSMLSPMPGKVLGVMVTEGEQVTKDQAVMIIEAMKMEHVIRANRDGVVASVHFQQGDAVQANSPLLSIED